MKTTSAAIHHPRRRLRISSAPQLVSGEENNHFQTVEIFIPLHIRKNGEKEELERSLYCPISSITDSFFLS